MPIEFDIETTIARAPDDVFAFVTDPSRLPEWQPRVVEAKPLQDGPLRTGSRLLEVREVRGKRLEQTVEVAAYEPPRHFALKVVDGPLPIDGEITLTPAPDGHTHLRLHAHGRAPGAMRLLSPLLKVGLKREFRAQYRQLRDVLEAPAGSAHAQ